MGTGRVRMKTPTTAQTPPIALPVSDAGVCVPYPTEKRFIMYLLWIFCQNVIGNSLYICTVYNQFDLGMKPHL